MKQSKTAAAIDYRPATGRSKECCGNCIMFQPPDSCTLVRGIINKTYVCDRWAPKEQK